MLDWFKRKALTKLPFDISVKALEVPHIMHSLPLIILLIQTGAVDKRCEGNKNDEIKIDRNITENISQIIFNEIFKSDLKEFLYIKLISINLFKLLIEYY